MEGGKEMLLYLFWRAEFVPDGWQKQLFGTLDRGWVSFCLAAQKRTNYDITEQTTRGVSWRKLG